MSYYTQQRRTGLSSSLAFFMLLVTAAAAANGSFASRGSRDVLPATPSTKVAAESRWTPGEVRQLIAAIKESERYGLDPQSYGLAALRSELDQASELWGRNGSHQLDVLAHTAALALANDYRRRAGLAPAASGELNAALAAGSLRSWLVPAHDPSRGG